MATLFDRHAETYQSQVNRAVAFSGKDVDFFTKTKATHLLQTAERWLGPTKNLDLLDVGCGAGLTDRLLMPHVRRLHGVDVSEEMIERAQAANPSAQYVHYDGHHLPYSDSTFDIAIAICVMHHVAPDAWTDLLREMKRVIRPDGLVAIYEHNPLNPLTQRVVSQCEFDEDAVLLSNRTLKTHFRRADLKVVQSPYILMFPFSPSFFRRVERSIDWIPLGAQYAVFGTKRQISRAA